MSDAPPHSPATRLDMPSAALAQLAQAHGVAAEYDGWDGTRQRSSARALRAVLAAMGIEAGDDEQCQRLLDEARSASWRRTLPQVTVVRAGHGGQLAVHVPDGAAVEVLVMLEDGGTLELAQLDVWVEPRVIDGELTGRATFALPAGLALGYHRLEATVYVADEPVHRDPVEAPLIVTPDRLELPPSVVATRPWGIMAQLYSVRSRDSWAVGDLADLRDLCTLAAERAGADFVLINPLHAAEPVPPLTPSPYLPSSRQWINPLYIRVEDVPEVQAMPDALRASLGWLAEAPRAAAASPVYLDRDTAWTAKRSALAQAFAMPRTPERQRAFDDFCAARGQGLVDFARWSAIADVRQHRPGAWPASLDGATADGVEAFADKHADRVEFYAWLQFLADEQLAAAQQAARDAGMSVGVIADLAVGSHPAGADAWTARGSLAAGIGIGAPPDMYNQQGQNWSPQPWLPGALAATAYAPFRALVQAAVRHVGALRIDHVMGLFRQWWVPDGLAASDGAYVRQDHEALVGILALEAHRAGTVVIGEDLGTVEPWVRDYLSERGVLGTTVLWWEPMEPEQQRPGVLATVTTHDLPPTLAYLAGEHVDLRERLGLFERDVAEERAAAAAERQAMVERLAARGWCAPEASDDEVLLAMHRAVMHTPAALTGVAVTDLVGDRRAQNQPGTDREYPNWRVPLTDARGAVVPLEELFDHPRARALVETIRAARG